MIVTKRVRIRARVYCTYLCSVCVEQGEPKVHTGTTTHHHHSWFGTRCVILYVCISTSILNDDGTDCMSAWPPHVSRSRGAVRWSPTTTTTRRWWWWQEKSRRGVEAVRRVYPLARAHNKWFIHSYIHANTTDTHSTFMCIDSVHVYVCMFLCVCVRMSSALHAIHMHTCNERWTETTTTTMIKAAVHTTYRQLSRASRKTREARSCALIRMP